MKVNANKSIEIRPIQSKDELEAVYEILDQCFPVGKAYFQSRNDHNTSYRYETTWVAIVDGVIASTIQVFPYPCRIGNTTVRVGGIGSVATLPEYRGRGLCQQILECLTDWMKQQQYDLSLLFAVITPFYEKYGWNIVPEANYELNIKKIPENLPSRSEYKIIPFDQTQHLLEAAEIYHQFNHNRTLTCERSLTYWQDMLKWQGWKSSIWRVAIKDRKVVAYGRMSKESSDGHMHLEELCYSPGEEASVVPLFQALSKVSASVQWIQAKLLPDHVLFANFQQWGAERKDFPYAMWKIIQLPETLKKLQPVLEQRLQQHAISDFRLAVACREQSALIVFDRNQLSISSEYDSHQETTAVIQQADWVQCMLHGFHLSLPIQLRPGSAQQLTKKEIDSIFTALFPVQQSIFYLSDKF